MDNIFLCKAPQESMPFHLFITMFALLFAAKTPQVFDHQPTCIQFININDMPGR